MACPTTTLPCRISATSLCTVRTSSPAVGQTRMINYDISVSHIVVCYSLQLLSWLTVFDVLWSDATDGCPVVCHLLCGFHVFVIDAFPKLIHEGHASQDAVLSIRTDSHHLAINGHGSGEANGWRKANRVIKRGQSSLLLYVNLPEEFKLERSPSVFVTYIVKTIFIHVCPLTGLVVSSLKDKLFLLSRTKHKNYLSILGHLSLLPNVLDFYNVFYNHSGSCRFRFVFPGHVTRKGNTNKWK